MTEISSCHSPVAAISQVECAWRVSNPQRQKRYEDFLKKLPDMAEDRPLQLPEMSLVG